MAMIGINHIRDFSEAKKLIETGKVYYPNLENTKNINLIIGYTLSCINRIRN